MSRCEQLGARGLAAVVILGVTTPGVAHASYQDGAAGLFAAVLALPVVAVGVVVLLVLLSRKAFCEGNTFAVYAATWAAASLVPLGLVLGANDPLALGITLGANAIYLTILIAPAYRQYSRGRADDDSESAQL